MSMLMVLMTGCGTSKYEAVELPEETEVPVVALTLEGTEAGGAENEAGSRGGNASEHSAEAAENNVEKDLIYQECDDYLIVTADALNIREADNTEARILAQLPTGEILHRTAYNAAWCRIEYEDCEAYVSADMVEEYISEELAAGETESDSTEGTIGEAVAAASALPTDHDQPTDDSDRISTGIPDYRKTGDVQTEAYNVPLNGRVVAIDAGCQAKANAEKEPIGPTSEIMKAKMPAGAVGTVSGVKEYELTLIIAQKLEKELRSQGYEVVMTRTSHDVNLSNAERSMIANDSNADIFIRLNANSMENSGVYGAMATCMTEYNPYNAELSAESYRLSKLIIDNICFRTGTKNRGVQKVDNSGRINWCEIPVSAVDMGFLTNPDEDRWLQDEEYQNKIVNGISDAVNTYFGF